MSLVDLLVGVTRSRRHPIFKSITIETANVNEAPTAISLDKGDYAEVLENQPKDTFVSLISTVDPESRIPTPNE